MEQEIKKPDSKKAYLIAIKVIIGLAFLVFGVAAMLKWLPALLVLIKGLIGIIFIMIGLVILAVAKD